MKPFEDDLDRTAMKSLHKSSKFMNPSTRGWYFDERGTKGRNMAVVVIGKDLIAEILQLLNRAFLPAVLLEQKIQQKQTECFANKKALK